MAKAPKSVDTPKNDETSELDETYKTDNSEELPTDELKPARIKMTRPHGFIEEETGNHRYWHQDQVVISPQDIALLTERGAEFEPVEG